MDEWTNGRMVLVLVLVQIRSSRTTRFAFRVFCTLRDGLVVVVAAVVFACP
jgi:hypothetical protein